ncbi:peptidoglycan-binding protein [Flavisphingomonas formosensis]|uniref:peptidoglycan-binding protein n=1 Tax=Flavisphingomonas formosensis TaxID=861534 RepID=UPI0012FA2232|nr:peptidoglycan-binding protein [Sphingomonas formosensis]
MTRKRFLIPSLVAAGFGAHDPAQAALIHATTTGADDPNAGAMLRMFTQDHYVTLADHRSHSSHSSHASHSSGFGGGGGHYSHSSHTSHRSAGGGYDSPSYSTPTYTAPEPTRSPPPASRPAPAAPLFTPSARATPPPATDALPALSGRTKRFASIVRRVQLALLAQGFYNGRIDGIVGPGLRKALRAFQKVRGIAVTGTITPQTLDALMISSE